MSNDYYLSSLLPLVALFVVFLLSTLASFLPV